MRILTAIFISLFLLSFQIQAKTLTELLQQGQDNLASGNYYEANEQLKQLETQSIQDHNSYTTALAKGLQGYIALQRQDNNLAEQLLTAALSQSQQNAWTDLMVRFNVYLGELSERQHNFNQARYYFTSAQGLASNIADKSFLISCLINQAKLAISDINRETATQLLKQAKSYLESVPVNQSSSFLWLSLGYQGLQIVQLSQKDPQLNQQNNLAEAFYALDKALAQAKQVNQQRNQALALLYLARLYQQQRPEEAINLLLAGISIATAQQENTEDILLDLEWQLAVVYQKQNNLAQAIAAFRRAVKHLEKQRLDIPVFYQNGDSSFKKTFAPLYLGLTDLLLQKARLATPHQQQDLLIEARDTIELMKQSEMEDYFQSRCDIAATPIDLKKIDTHTAVIYPISLPDRLEIIVDSAQGLSFVTQNVTAYELEQKAILLADNIRHSKRSKPQSQLFYQWLISPIKPLLDKQHIDTLLYIPDGALRRFPLAVLHDGKKYLIEDYAVVTSPGLSLITADKDQEMGNSFFAGLSKPGDVISELPEDFLNFVGSNARGLEKKLPMRELSKNPLLKAELKKELELPSVETEVKQLAAAYQTGYLLNEDFSLANFTKTLTAQPHKILHIASHGYFNSMAETSFIMTYDKLLTMNALEKLLTNEFFSRHPIDLISLSACQTAEGDDRSPLGISGIAIKFRVRSSLGSLWVASDEATAVLMSAFYQALKTPGVSKAKALQMAELSLLKQKRFQNPWFWSAFILTGNWL